ncbi:MAG: hypothetical protein WCS01_02005 [bacterium]
MSDKTGLSSDDLQILRTLARRKMDIASDPVNLERRDAWYRLDAGAKDSRPMLLTEPNAIVDVNRPLPVSALQCRDAWARDVECGLRYEIFMFEALKDDHVVEPFYAVNWHVSISDYGVPVVEHRADDYQGMGSRSWDPPIKDLERDFAKLHPRSCAVNRESTLAYKARMEAIFGTILPVTLRGSYCWSHGMTNTAINLVGLENLMLFMFDQPEGLHRLMGFLRDDYIAVAKWMEKEELLTLNNLNDYIGSGSMGYTRDLPQPDWKPGLPVRTRDLWVLSESQETVGVGPEQFAEFIFPYQRSVIERFGKCYYGCCEPVNNRWHILKTLPTLARVSVSPWADEAFMARECGRRIVYSRKPNPTLISTSRFDEDAIRADLRHTLSVAGGCRLEIIMKDVHTLNNCPERLARWVELAREAIADTTG